MKKREPLFNAWQKIAYGVIFLDLLIGGVGFVQAGSVPVVRHLMTYPNWSRSVRGKDVRLHKIQAKNASGTVINVPATGVDVLELFGDVEVWKKTNLARVPIFTTLLPDSLRHKVALFYS